MGSGRRSSPRLAGFTNIEDALEGWHRRDERCYQLMAGLTALGSRRGGDDDDAALAVVVLLEDGVARVVAGAGRYWAGGGRAGAPGNPTARNARNAQDRDLAIVLPEVEDPVEDLADLLTWARKVGVIATDEIDLLVELLAADHDGMPREDAQRLVGERRGVSLRTIRRRRAATVARLRAAAPKYLTAAA